MTNEAELSPDSPTVPASPDLDQALTGTPDSLLPALKRRGFEKLTAVQEAVANADDGRRDLRISSQTGSGKTVAIGFALADRVLEQDRVGPTTLIIAPTRELAMQVKEELAWLFADLPRVGCEVVTGGTSLDRERLRLRRKPSVLVGTPGRLLDHLRRGSVDISSVSQLVLDEADQMLDLGFKDELDGILECLPEERRTHLVSATFPPAVLELANRFQCQPILIQGTAPGEAHDDIEHIACRIGDREHYQSVVNMLLMAGEERTLVFVRTREETTRMADKLAADGFAAAAINGDLAQAQRTRTLAAFRSGRTRALIATDVAARGLDIPSVTMVIHVELPIDSATYVHRSGRTGRAGQKGKSVLLVPKSRANRTTRLFRILRLQPRWVWAPTPEAVTAKQLERAQSEAVTMLTAAPAATAEKRAMAANLLQERDPVEVVALLLGKTMTTTREPFQLVRPRPESQEHEPAARTFTPRESEPRPAGFGNNKSVRKLSAEHRGQPGAVPSWQKDNRQDPQVPEAGFTRFRINWGPRDGANPRRIMAHICRRGDVPSNMIGSISMDGNSSTFEVANNVADDFAHRVQQRDRRDPHLIIHRETFARRNYNGGGNFRGARGASRDNTPYRGPMRTRQSR
jgi:ATP-dependent RNA helicase DeaD